MTVYKDPSSGALVQLSLYMELCTSPLYKDIYYTCVKGFLVKVLKTDYLIQGPSYGVLDIGPS